MPMVCRPGTFPLPRIKNDDGTIQHVYCHGSREHVIWYTSVGMHCTEKDCEVNRARNEGNEMTPAQEFHYLMWRMDMWIKGYGSYRVIDRAARMGVLKPFMNYPTRERSESKRMDTTQ